MSCESSSEVSECAVCLDECLNGVRLECSHVFCYLCAKGSAQQSSSTRCPVCRHPISQTYFDRPNLIGAVRLPGAHMDWQYEGRNGWWLYDCRTSREIQKAFDANEASVEVLIAGFVYVIDFSRMIQFRRNEPNRIRRIRRQPLDPNTTKGVAGLRAQFADTQHQTNQSSHSSVDNNTNEVIVDQTSDANEDNRESEAEARDGEQEMAKEVMALQQTLSASLSIKDNTRETYL